MRYCDVFDALEWDKEPCECGECDSAIWCKNCKNYGRNCTCLVTKDILKKYIESNRHKEKFVRLATQELK